jgi:long-chain acyl-CoA synthetase
MPKKSGFRRSFAFAGEMIDRGASVLVFPEGQHTEDGKMHGFKPGTGLLISELEVPVVPVRIDGLWELKVAKRRHARPGELSVHIGEPASYAAHDAPEWITADLEERMRRL